MVQNAIEHGSRNDGTESARIRLAVSASTVEFVVIDQRAGWVLGRLGDGRETWIEQRDVELVGV